MNLREGWSGSCPERTPFGCTHFQPLGHRKNHAKSGVRGCQEILGWEWELSIWLQQQAAYFHSGRRAEHLRYSAEIEDAQFGYRRRRFFPRRRL